MPAILTSTLQCLEPEIAEGKEIHLLSESYQPLFQHFSSRKENTASGQIKHCSAWLPHHSFFLAVGIY